MPAPVVYICTYPTTLEQLPDLIFPESSDLPNPPFKISLEVGKLGFQNCVVCKSVKEVRLEPMISESQTPMDIFSHQSLIILQGAQVRQGI